MPEAKAFNLPVTPILRWAGSKKRSLRQIVRFVPAFDGRYVEVFAGSACLFFRLRPSTAVIADNNRELIRFYEVLSKSPADIYAKFAAIPRNPASFYAVRSARGDNLDDITRSAYFLYLNRNCFNGIYRTNTRGEFNVPFASQRVAPYPSFAEVLSAAAVLSRAKLRCGDFETICLEEVHSSDLVYLDPPYYVPSVRVFREYSSKPFAGQDLKRLSVLLDEIDRRGAKFLLSYPDCEPVADLARRWRADRVAVRRTIAGNVAARGYTPELLIHNYDICPSRSKGPSSGKRNRHETTPSR